MTYEPGHIHILLEKYRIEALLGQGAFGEVYRVTHLGLNVQRALKVLRRDAPGIGTTEFNDGQARFQLEAQLGAQLNSPTPHPNLLQIHNFEKAGDPSTGSGQALLALEMEYAPGGSLSERLGKAREQGQPIPIEEALQIALDVASGLAVLHARDIVHRDIKPSNILFDGKGRAKLADLGLAQIPGGPSLRSQLSNLLPHPGTPGYMSPEQELSGNYLTPASDIYALGVTLFEMLTGRVYRSLRPGTPASKLRSEIPTWLDELLGKMLAKSVDERPWDGMEAEDVLRGALDRFKTGKVDEQTAIEEKIQAEAAEKQARLESERKTQGEAAEKARLLEEQSRRELILDLGKGVTMEFVRVPAGEFWMGGDKSINKWASNDDTPRHKVYLDEYLIGKTPVTNRQYWIFVQKAKYRAPSYWKDGKIPASLEDHPVINVSWKDAVTFCKWASQNVGRLVRLPSEAEWEKAARWKPSHLDGGGEALMFPWGNPSPNPALLNYRYSNSDQGGTTPVGKYSPQGDSPYGCVDMAGNVWEWCADWYDAKYYHNTPNKNPPGPSFGDGRVVRGGSWDDNCVRSAYRYRLDPVGRYLDVGFRCARSH